VRTTIDIPDETYRKVKMLAAERGTTVRELVLEGLEIVKEGKQTLPRKRFEIPVIRSKRPGTLHLTNEQIDDLTAFS
jgi:hypothetical protein